MQLNTLFRSLWIATVLFAVSSPFSFSSVSLSMDDEPIEIKPDPNGPNNPPKTPIYNPFFAEYIEGLNSIVLGSYSDIGDVEVTVSSTAGDWIITIFDTSDGTTLIPISGGSGSYTITLETADGLTFVGDFIL